MLLPGLVQALGAGVHGDSGSRSLVPSSPAGIDFPDAVRVYTSVCTLRYTLCGECACVHVGRDPLAGSPGWPGGHVCPADASRCCVRDPGPAFSWEQCSAVCLLDPALATVWSWGQNGSLCNMPCCQRRVGDSHPDLVTQKWWDGVGQGPGQGRRAEPAPSQQPLQRGLCCPRRAYKEPGSGEVTSPVARLASGRAGLEPGMERASRLRLGGLGRRPWVPREWQGPTCPLPPPSILGSSSLAWDRVWPPWLSSPHGLTRSRDGPVGTEASEASEA